MNFYYAKQTRQLNIDCGGRGEIEFEFHISYRLQIFCTFNIMFREKVCTTKLYFFFTNNINTIRT